MDLQVTTPKSKLESLLEDRENKHLIFHMLDTSGKVNQNDIAQILHLKTRDLKLTKFLYPSSH